MRVRARTCLLSRVYVSVCVPAKLCECDFFPLRLYYTVAMLLSSPLVFRESSCGLNCCVNVAVSVARESISVQLTLGTCIIFCGFLLVCLLLLLFRQDSHFHSFIYYLVYIITSSSISKSFSPP